MAKVDPFKLKRPAKRRETRSFTDPMQPGEEIVLTLQSLDAAELAVASEEAKEQIETWVTGNRDRPASQFPFVDRLPVQMTETLCTACSILFRMQAPEDPADRYSWNDLVALSVTMPTAWGRVMEWMQEILAPKAVVALGEKGGTS